MNYFEVHELSGVGLLRFVSVIFACLLGLPTTVLAASEKPEFYVCSITKGIKHTNWISESTAFIVYDDRTVKVLDGAIMYFFKEALDAKSSRRGQELRINWSLSGVRDSRKQRVPQFRYNARLNTKTKQVSISARALGFSNRYHGQGSCEIKDKL